MMLLIALALIVPFGANVAGAVGWPDLEFWWELALLVDVMLLGHLMEMWALGQATSALEARAALLPDTAERVTQTGTEEVAFDALHPGDVVLVRSGARVPADGTIVEGEAVFDESMITGESRSVTRDRATGSWGGTIATDSSVRVRVTAVGEETTLAGIRRLVAEAQASRSRAQALADRGAALLFSVALASGTITLIAWLAAGEPDQAIGRTVTVLVIACPHALGLAITLVVAISTAMSARDGILVKDRLALERTRTVDTVLFDKTGTLTTGTPAVREVVADAGDEDTALSFAAAAEAVSEHLLARAIVEEARRRGSTFRPGRASGRSPGAGSARPCRGPTSRWEARPCCGSWGGDAGRVLRCGRRLATPRFLDPHRGSGRETCGDDRAGGHGASRVPAGGRRPPEGGAPGADDRRRCA